MDNSFHAPKVRPPKLIFVILLVNIFATTCQSQLPPLCKIRQEDGNVACFRLTNFHTIISFLQPGNTVPSHLLINESPSLKLTKADLQNPTLQNIVYINLEFNLIRVFNPEPLTGLQKLHALTLSFNKITSIDENTFQGLNLKNIVLDKNQITNIADGSFRNLVKLYSLSISGNKLTQLPATLFQGLRYLYLLNFNGNELTHIDDKLFEGLTNLKYLHLSNNKIACLSPQTLKSHSILATLDLSGNQLEIIDKDVFEGNTNLISLDISHNDISNFENVVLNISTLKILKIHGNNNQSIPRDFFLLTSQLAEVTMSNGNFNTTPVAVFDAMPKLRVLRLSGMSEVDRFASYWRNHSYRIETAYKWVCKVKAVQSGSDVEKESHCSFVSE